MTIREVNYGDIPNVSKTHAAARKVAFGGIFSDELLNDFRERELEQISELILQHEIRLKLVAENLGCAIRIHWFRNGHE